MNKDTKQTIVKPACRLTSQNGNVFNIIGLVTRSLKKAGQPDQAKAFQTAAFSASSYDVVLQLAMDYVDVK